MILVVDANSVISALIKNNWARRVIVSDTFDLVSPEFLTEELEKNNAYMIKKTGMPKGDLNLLLLLLLKHIHIIPKEEYEGRMTEAESLMEKDLKDVPYVAVYLALKCDGIWTNDKHYDKNELRVFKTESLLKLI